MISLAKISKKIENELNAKLAISKDIRFKIWSDVGKYKKSEKNGNTVIYYINGCLASIGGSNEDNLLAIGVNSLSLEFMIPTKQPKTSAKEKPNDLNEIKDDQYFFINTIKTSIDSFFERAFIYNETDEETGITYSIAISSALTTTGVVDIYPNVGEALPLTANITLSFVELGVNAQNIKIFLDEEQLPISNQLHGRSYSFSSDVFSNSDKTIKAVNNGSALSYSFAVPLTSSKLSQTLLDELYENKLNTAHFVRIQIPENRNYYYLMTLQDLKLSAQGVTFAGIQGSLVEIQPNPFILNIPENYEIGRFILNELPTSNINLGISYISYNIKALYVGDKFFINKAGGFFITITPKDVFLYDEKINKYYLLVYACGKTNMEISSSKVKYEIVREAKNE